MGLLSKFQSIELLKGRKMKSFLVLLSLLFASTVMAGETDHRSFNYDGSRGQRALDLFTETTRTEYRWVQVPYTERICRNETRYRQECRQEPGRQVCRQEPGRQVCRNTPPRRVCRTRPDGRQICNTQPGRRICRTEPGRRVCRTEPGRRVCRQVPYTERVCRNETRYRQERRAYTVVDTRTKAEVRFWFSPSAFEFLGINIDVQADLFRDQLNVRIADRSTPGVLILDQVAKSRFGSRENLTIVENHKIDLFNSESLFAPIRGQLRTDDVYNNEMILHVAKVAYPTELGFDLTIKRAGQVVFSRNLAPADYQLRHGETESAIVINLRALGLKLPVSTVVDVDFGMHLTPSRYLNSSQYQDWSRRHSFQRVIR